MNSLTANLNSVVTDHEHGDGAGASWSGAAAASGWEPPVATICSSGALDSRFHNLISPNSASGSGVRSQEWPIDWSENQMILATAPSHSQYSGASAADHNHQHHHHHHQQEHGGHEDHQNAVTVASSESALRHYTGFLTAAHSSCIPATVEAASSSGCWATSVLINAAMRQTAAQLEASPGSAAAGYGGAAAAAPQSLYGGLGLTSSGSADSPPWMQAGNNQTIMNNYLGHVGENRSAAAIAEQQQQQQRHSQYLLAGFGAGGGMMEQQRIHDIFKGGLYNNCGGGAAAADLSAARIGLNLGGRTYFSAEDSYAAASFAARFGGKRFQAAAAVAAASCLLPSSAMAHHVPLCQAEGCKNDLSQAKHYHRRHKVCEYHSKASTVLINGNTQRFCQQCSRFHGLSEFDEGKRSCRKRLADHNRRRRKPQPAPLTTAQAPPSEASNTISGNISTPSNVDVNGAKRSDDQLSTETNNYNMGGGGTAAAATADGVLISTGSGINEQQKSGLAPGGANLPKAAGGADSASPLIAQAATAPPSVLLTLQNHGGSRAAVEATEMRSSASDSMAAAATTSSDENEMKESAGTSNYAAANYFLSLSSSSSSACSAMAAVSGPSCGAASSSGSPGQRAAAMKAFEEETVPWLRASGAEGRHAAAMARGASAGGMGMNAIEAAAEGQGSARYDGKGEEQGRVWAVALHGAGAERHLIGGDAGFLAAQQQQQRMSAWQQKMNHQDL